MENDKQHYSEEVIKALISQHGWRQGYNDHTAEKSFFNEARGGALDPAGDRIFVVRFVEPRLRYAELISGWKTLIDFDGRPAAAGPAAVLELAARIDAAAAEFNN